MKDELYSFNPVGGYYLNFNVNEVKEVKVREAMTYAVDRKALCDSVLFGTAIPNSNFIQDGLIGADDSAEQFEYDQRRQKHFWQKLVIRMDMI